MTCSQNTSEAKEETASWRPDHALSGFLDGQISWSMPQPNAPAKEDMVGASRRGGVSDELLEAQLHQIPAVDGVNRVMTSFETSDRILSHLQDCRAAMDKLCDTLRRSIEQEQRQEVYSDSLLHAFQNLSRTLAIIQHHEKRKAEGLKKSFEGKLINRQGSCY